MKKIFKYSFGLLGMMALAACSGDKLETQPTDSVSGTTLFSDAKAAMVPLNGLYRSMYTSGWSTTGNTHQCFGVSAYCLASEVMGDDFVMGAQGSGWFWFDAAYNVKGRFTNSAWRSYDLWYAFYTWIANANYVIAAEETMGGATEDVNYVIGQAYAVRAYSYFQLAQWFARTYKGHESEPCAPIYNEPTFKTTTGQPRATVADVYKQIDSDLEKALTLLKGIPQQDKTHMAYAVTCGIASRVALVEENWSKALELAKEAIDNSGCSVQPVAAITGMNSVGYGDVMWGAKIKSDQAGMYASLFAHMDPAVAYAARAPKQISRWLYNKIDENDQRRAWWNPDENYLQKKFSFSNVSTWEGDYVWMRVEEMYFNAAEAACRLGDEAQAKNYLMAVMSQRDPSYACEKTGTALGALTTDETGSLLEEILIQKRIELWGEFGRTFDIRRLKQGFQRTSDQGWPDGLLLKDKSGALRPTANPENYMWVLTIPQAEFDGNINMTVDKDQNPAADE
jgi:hypothetical protein